MSGIGILRRILMKQAMKKSKDASGIMSLNKGLVDDVDNTVKKWVDSAKRQGQDIDKMGEQEIKYIIELNKPKAPTTLAELMEKIGLNDPKKNKFLRKEGEVFDLTGKKIKNTENIVGGEEVITDVVSDTVTNMKAMTPMDAMKEANLVIARKGKYKNLTIDESQDILKKTNDHIFERDIKYDEFGEIIKPDPEDFAQGGRASTGLNYLLGEDDQNSRVPYASGSRKKEPWRDKLVRWGGGPSMVAGELGFEGLHQIYNLLGMGGLYAEGGRTGFGLGGMSRRGFLKLMAALGATGVAAKSGLATLLKGGGKKAVIKDLTSVPINNIKGMPAWFKPLVNKVIKEGEQMKVTEYDRLITHKSQLPNSKTDVYVNQDLNTGDVWVEIGQGKHGFPDGHLGQPVRLEYKASEVIEPTEAYTTKNINEKTGKVYHKGGKTKEEFWVEEAEFTGGHPENVKFEESTFEKFGEHGSDFSEVEKFATGKVKKVKPTKKAERTEWESGKAEADADAAARMDEEMMTWKEVEESAKKGDLPDDFASGGRVPFIFGGGAIKNVFKRLKDLRKMPRTEKIMKPRPAIQHLFTEADKLELSALKLEHAEAMLDMLKSDRDLFLQFQSNKAMKDEGLDFLMKKMLEPMAPHIKGYKSLKEIDEAILNMEMIVKNKTLKQGRQLNATGGRVPLVEGGTPSAEDLEQYYRDLEKQRERERRQREFYEQRFGGPGPILEAASGGLAGMLGE